jgi:hypothetical protein
MAAVKAKAAPRTPTRDEPAARMPETRLPERDNVIRNRAGQPVSLQFTGSEDEFAFDRSIIPPGWDYQWKVKTIKNWEWTQHQVRLAANGWEPVPASRHDGMFMPRGATGPIERGGHVLMERDMRLTEQMRRLERKAANEPVINSRSMAGLMAQQVPNVEAMADFGHGEAQRVSGVKIERQPRLPDRNYQYTLDE